MFMLMFILLSFKCFLKNKKKNKNRSSSKMLSLCSSFWLKLGASSRLWLSPHFLVLHGECSMKLDVSSEWRLMLLCMLFLEFKKRVFFLEPLCQILSMHPLLAFHSFQGNKY